MIDSFSGKYRFLSNFWPCRVTAHNLVYPSVEHAYQASKTLIREEYEAIQRLEKPGEAKRAGRKVTIRSDWDAVKLDTMHTLVLQKFWFDPYLGKLLKETGTAELIEGNSWGDTFWGVCKGKGENHLGKILMKVREEL